MTDFLWHPINKDKYVICDFKVCEEKVNDP